MEEVKKLYTALIGKGYTANDLGNEDVFAKKMQDEQNRKELYDYVSSRGDFKIGSYDNYEQRLRPAQVQKPQPVVDAYGMPMQPEVSTIEDAPKIPQVNMDEFTVNETYLNNVADNEGAQAPMERVELKENLKSDLFKPQSTETPSLLNVDTQRKDYFAEAGAKAMEDIRQERQAREYQEIMKPLSGIEGREQKKVLEERKRQIEAQLNQSDAVRNAAARTNMAKALENVDKELQVLDEQQKQWQEQYGSWTPSSARRFREQTMGQTWYDPYAVVPEEYKALATQKWGKEGSEDAYFSAWMNLSPKEREAFVKREHIKTFFNEETANRMQGIRERATTYAQNALSEPVVSVDPRHSASAMAARTVSNIGVQTTKALDKAEEIKQAYKNHQLDENFFAGAYKGMKDGLTDIDNWTGLYMVGEMANLYDIADKMEKGEALSQTEEDFLDAQAYKLAVEAALADDLGWGYSSGNVTGASVPFMLQMLASPIGGASGKAIDKGFAAVGRRAIDKFGKGILKKLLTKTPVKKVVKGLVGTVGKGIGQTILFGSDRVAAGTMERHLGNEMVAERANEEFNAGVQAKAGEDLGTALFKAGVSASMENISEFAGGAFIDDFTKMVGKKIAKEFMDAMGGSAGRRMANAAAKQNANKVFRAIANNKWGQHAVNLSKSVQSGMAWDGLLNEYLEEVLNNASNVMIGDMSMEDFTSLEKNAETLLGLAWASGFFMANNAASRVGGYVRGNIALKRTDRAARQIFSGDMQEKWNAYTQALSQADGYEEVEQLYKGLVADISKNQDKERAKAQMSEATAYMANYVKMMGMNAATEEADEEEQKTPAQKDIETAQGEGIAAQGTEEEMDVVEEMDESYNQLAGHLGETNVEEWLLQYGETADKQMEAIRGSELDEQTKAVAEAYLTSAQRYEGLLLANQEEVDAIVDEAAKEFDANVNQELGSVIQVLTTQGKTAYVIQGNPNEREDIRLRYEDGTTEPVSHVVVEKVLSQADAQTMRSDMIEGVRKSAVAEVVKRMQGAVPNATQMQMPVGHNVVVDGQAGVVAGVNADGTMQIQMQGGNVVNAAPQQVMDAQAYNNIMERKARARESARVSMPVREEVVAPVAEEATAAEAVAEEAVAEEAVAAEEELTEAQKLLQEYMDESVSLEDRQTIVGNNVAQAKQAAMEAQAEVDAMTESKPKATDYTSIAEFKQAQEQWKAQMQEKQQALDLARQQEATWSEVQKGMVQPVETATEQASAEVAPVAPQVTEVQRAEAKNHNSKHDIKALAKEIGVSAKRIQRVIDFANQVGVKLNFANITRTQGNAGALTNADNMASKREITLSKYMLAKGLPIEWVMGHELTHQIKADGNAENWEAYKQAIKGLVGENTFDALVAQQAEVYRKAGAYQNMPADAFMDAMEEEVCADMAGNVFLNPNNISKVIGMPQSLVSRIWNALKDMVGLGTPKSVLQAVDAWQQLAEGKELTGKEEAERRHSLVGTTGARALDKAEGTTVRMDNMDVAEEMEAAGKDAETIWMATGWERGADGKWRYEVLEDFAYEEPRAKAERLQEEYQQVQNEKENIYRYLNRFPARGLTEQQKAIKKEQNARLKNLIKKSEQLQDEIIESNFDTTLGELIGTDNNIIKAYPELASMPVSFVKSSRFMDAGLKGAFDGEGIWINPTLENTAPTLLHEVQHAIQRIEGFARGGNTGSVKTKADALREDVRPLHEMMLDTPEWAERQRLQNRWFDETDAAEIAKIEQRVSEINESGVLDAIQSKRKQLQEKYGSDATVGKILGSPYAEDAEIWQQLPESFNDKYEAYRNLAGEAEARNVSARLNMSEEERRQTRPGKTEDVTREEQTVRYSIPKEPIGRSLAADEAEILITDMKENADIAPELEFSIENWLSEFGKDGLVTTPIGKVKMGENQIAKLLNKNREKRFGLIRPTLQTPDVIIEKHAPAEGAERESKFLFIKTFVKPDGSRFIHFESVTVLKDGMDVSISSHEIGDKALRKEMQNGTILHLNSKLSSGFDKYLTKTPTERPDLAPTSDNRLVISSSLGGGVSPISHADDAAPAISLQSRNDDELSAGKDTQSVSTEQTDRKEISEKSAESNVEVTNEEVASLPKKEGEQALFSISTYEQQGREILETYVMDQVSKGRLTQEQADDIISEMEDIYNICVGLKDKYAPFGNWSEAEVIVDKQGKPVFSVIKANGDYAMNLDFSLVCKKRRTLDAVLREMIDRGIINNYELGQVDMAKINDIIRQHGFETACRLCFVDAKRFRVAQVADVFCEMYNALVDKSDAQLKKISKKEGKSVPGKIARMLLEHPENRVKLSRANFMDSKGFEDMTVNAEEIMKLYNAKKGTGGPKASYGDTQYLNDILGKQWSAESAYEVGGVRLQSFSDYVPRMVFDYIQMVADLSAKGLPVHAYTKEPTFAKQFGLTGIKINLNLVPRVEADGVAPGLDANGEYIWQEGETFPYEEAIAIQNAEGYRENCGTIAVGVSDAHIEKMLSDDNIRMVIPYHKSGLNPLVAKHNNIDQFQDYTNEQNTRDANGNKLTKAQMKSHFNFNADLHKHGNPRLAAQHYLEWCDKKGYIPKFEKFREHPNYYKLLEDFTTCVTENGVDTFVPQGAVTMTFPNEESAFGSIAELIEEGLEEDAVLEGRRQADLGSIADDIESEFAGGKKFSLSAEEQDAENADIRYSMPGHSVASRIYGHPFTGAWQKFLQRAPKGVLKPGYGIIDESRLPEFADWYRMLVPEAEEYKEFVSWFLEGATATEKKHVQSVMDRVDKIVDDYRRLAEGDNSVLSLANNARFSISPDILAANERFNEELDEYIKKGTKANFVFHIGQPLGIMKLFFPELPIVMRPRVINKASNTKHDVDAASLYNLPQYIAEPIFVFQREDGAIGVLTEMKDNNGKNVCVAVELNKKIQDGGTYLNVNDIRSIHGRDVKNIVLPIIHNNTLKYADKEKALEWFSSASSIYQQEITSQELSDATKIVQDFQNPPLPEDESSQNDANAKSGEQKYSLPAGIPRRRKNESLMDYANRIADILYAQRNATRDWELQEPAIALARDKYEDRVSSGWYQTKEALQDSMLGLKVFMESVLGKGTYIEDVAGVENAYLGENRLSSVNFAEASEFARLVFKPMLEEVAKLAKNEIQRQMLVDYMMAKHGLERNRVMAEKDAQAEAKENQMMTLDELRAKYRNKDYAGLTALTNKQNIRAAEAEAQAMVDAYESTHDTSALWDKVNKTNTATLTKMRESGLLSQDMYDSIANMYEFYIPLRGFDEKTSDEAYAYLSHKDSAFNAPIRRAKGRKSKADDPFAQMQAMAESAIMQGNRNVLVKQKLLNFVQNHPSDLATVSEMWIVYDAVNKEWTQITASISPTDTPADVARKTREFNETMEELHKLFPGRYQKAGGRNRIPYKVIAKNLSEHQVIVKRNGVDYVITINGSPRAAQAVNGMTNPDSGTGAVSKLFEYGEKVNRVLSGVYTSYNPDFLWSNFIRDTLYTNTMSYVKESPAWAFRFNRNFLKFNPATMGRLLSKWDNGKLDMNNKTEALFYQFMKNGGETGYANIRNIEQHKSEIKEALKKANGRISVKLAWDAVKNKLEFISRAAENGARFAAFATSMQMGRGVERAIYDAKEVSVNFNKKGSGATFMGATGQTAVGNAAAFTSGLGRSLYVFWNAAIQGSTNFGRQVKRHPVRALTVSSVMFGLGVLMSMIGGDDEDDENAFYNLPENIRRTNIMMRFGNHWLTLPLPVEYRAMYGMGQLAGEVLSGKSRMSDEELGMAILQQVSQMAPIDVLGAGGGWNAFMPSWAKPITDAYVLEKNWAGQPLYKDWDTYAPEWTKAYDSADQNIVGFTRWLNEATGGNDHRKGLADINPAKIEAVIDGYFGGISALTKNLVKTGEMLIGERDYQPRNIPLLRRVVYQGDERTAYRRANEQYRKYKEDHDELQRELRGYEGDMEMGTKDWTEELDRIYNSPEIEQYYIMDWYGKDISKLNKQFNETTDEEEKDAIRKEINLLKSEAVKEIENLQNKKEKQE